MIKRTALTRTTQRTQAKSTRRGQATPSKESIMEELERRLEPSSRQSKFGSDYLDLVPKIQCRNGLRMSVQASATHYCSPRTSDGHWYQVEIGFPTRKVPKLMPFAEEKKRPTETVYGYVPIDLVASVIRDNGGFAKKEAA